MEIKLSGREQQRLRAKKLWLNALSDYNEGKGLTPEQIEKKYNRKPGWFYYAMHQLRKIKV